MASLTSSFCLMTGHVQEQTNRDTSWVHVISMRVLQYKADLLTRGGVTRLTENNVGSN